jgi:hypothetical protein
MAVAGQLYFLIYFYFSEFIVLMMAAIRISETPVYSGSHGAISRKAQILVLLFYFFGKLRGK